jgi:alcohol dehydrogenase class IV
MRFEFATASQIIFGPGTLGEAATNAAQRGRNVFVITGQNVDRAAPLLQLLKTHGLTYSQFCVTREPTVTQALSAVQQAREDACDIVIGIGGGSVLDTGKVVAALLTNTGNLMDYLEVIGGGQTLRREPAAYFAIPTTAGTGSEVTRNAVLESPEHRVKVSIRSPLMLPRLAIVDPELTYSMPPAVTASTGLDAFTQLLEVFVSGHANPLTDAICREGLQRAARSLKNAFMDGNNTTARADMCLASLFGGLGLANAKLGAVHGLAGPLGGMYHAAHGSLCAALLPHVMKINVEALKDRMSESPALQRYHEVARIITGASEARADDGIGWVQNLCSQLNIPPLSMHGIKPTDFPAVVANAQPSSSMKGNPIALTDKELTEILRRAV